MFNPRTCLGRTHLRCRSNQEKNVVHSANIWILEFIIISKIWWKLVSTSCFWFQNRHWDRYIWSSCTSENNSHNGFCWSQRSSNVEVLNIFQGRLHWNLSNLWESSLDRLIRKRSVKFDFIRIPLSQISLRSANLTLILASHLEEASVREIGILKGV